MLTLRRQNSYLELPFKQWEIRHGKTEKGPSENMTIWEPSPERAFDTTVHPSLLLDSVTSVSHQSSPTSLKLLLTFLGSFSIKTSVLPQPSSPLILPILWGRVSSSSLMDSTTANILMTPASHLFLLSSKLPCPTCTGHQ